MGVSVWECLCGSVCVESHVLQDNGKFVANIFHRWRLSFAIIREMLQMYCMIVPIVCRKFVAGICCKYISSMAFVVCNHQANVPNLLHDCSNCLSRACCRTFANVILCQEQAQTLLQFCDRIRRRLG